MDICLWLVQTEGLCPAAVPLWGLPGTSPAVTTFFLRMTGQCICSPIAGEATGNEGVGEFSLIAPQVLTPSALCQFLFLFRLDSAVLHVRDLHFDISFCDLSNSSLLLTQFWNFRYIITDRLTSTEKTVLFSLVTLHGVMFISLVSFRIFLPKLVNILSVLYRCLLSCLRFPIVLGSIS